MLMLDRYLVAGGRALDLATGSAIHWRVRRAPAGAPPPLFTVRGRSWLIDFTSRGQGRIEVWERPAAGSFPPGGDEAVQALRAALADARDGRPRALDLAEVSTAAWARTHRLLAREARLAGFVPLAADAFGAVLAQARWRWPSWLKDRSIVIFATDTRLTPEASLALFRLATKDARPHLVVRGITGAAWRPRLVTAQMHVHESAPGEEPATAVALVERASALRAGGKPADAEAAARWGILLADSDEDDQSAKCELARCLLSQHRLLEARAVVLPLDGVEARTLRDQVSRAATPSRTEPAMVESFLEILRICQDVEDPTASLARVALRLNDTLAASRIAVVIRDRDRPHAAAHAGAALPAPNELALALEVLDTGVAQPPAGRWRAGEAAVPIRYGNHVVGALWAQWSSGVPLVVEDVASVMGLAATAAAPAVHEVCERLRVPSAPPTLVPELVGESAAIERVRHAVLRAAASPFPVLVEGESGSGKELVARAIHTASARRQRRFCALNCAAITDDLVEAELFGHTRGAFTGAVAERVGLFEEAQGGTLFLDEVAELSPRVQAKLLRVLQEGEVRRLGESATRLVDARIVAATNRPLAAEAAAGRFRGDLRYRLDVLRITIPPLRERLEDLPPLVRHIWAVLSARTGSRAVLSPAALARLGAYDWPGNVRELQNVLASVMVAGPPRGIIGPAVLPAHITRSAAMTGRATLADARREFEERYVRAALARAGGRMQAAAAELGVSRQGLNKLAARLGLDRPHGLRAS
jgi:DNA-binding NtrC family response regulator